MKQAFSAGELAYAIHTGDISDGKPTSAAQDAYALLRQDEMAEWAARGRRFLSFAQVECEKEGARTNFTGTNPRLGASNLAERFARMSLASESRHGALMARASFKASPSIDASPWIDASDYPPDQFLKDLDRDDPERSDRDRKMDALFIEFLLERHPGQNHSMNMVASDLGGDFGSYQGLDCDSVADYMGAAIQNFLRGSGGQDAGFKQAFHAFISASDSGREIRNQILRLHFSDDTDGMKRTHRHLFWAWLDQKRAAQEAQAEEITRIERPRG